MAPNRLSREQAAAETLLEVTIVEYYASSGVIAPAGDGYSEEQLAELRAARRLMADLELDHPAVEVILRMRQRMIGLQRELAQLQAELRRAQRQRVVTHWIEADWDD